MSLSDDVHRAATSISEAVAELTSKQIDAREFLRDINMRLMNIETNFSMFRGEVHQKLDLILRKLGTNGDGGHHA